MNLLPKHVKVTVVSPAWVPLDIKYQKMFLPLPQQHAIQKNQTLVLEISAVERSENTKKAYPEHEIYLFHYQ